MMICLLPFGRICNLVVSSPDVLQISQPTNFPDYARDCRRVKFSYFSLDKAQWSFAILRCFVSYFGFRKCPDNVAL